MLQCFVYCEQEEAIDAACHKYVEFVANEFLGELNFVATLRGALLCRLAVCAGRGIDDDSAAPVLDGGSQDYAGVVEVEPLDGER